MDVLESWTMNYVHDDILVLGASEGYMSDKEYLVGVELSCYRKERQRLLIGNHQKGCVVAVIAIVRAKDLSLSFSVQCSLSATRPLPHPPTNSASIFRIKCVYPMYITILCRYLQKYPIFLSKIYRNIKIIFTVPYIYNHLRNFYVSIFN